MIAPIISASWLWKYHAHLWSHGPARQPCHFLDILLALSVHQAISLADDDANDPYQMGGPPGYYYFERSQTYLLKSTTRPDLLTVQSYMYASIYMMHLHQAYKCHQMLALAARNADMMDPQNVPPFMERVNSVIVRARTCLALQALDNVLSTIASIPHLVPRQSSQDLIKVALHKSSESMQIFERISDTESFVQVTKLAQLVRDASESCSLYPSNRSRSNKGSSFDNLTEFCGITAAAVKSSIIPIHVWAGSLPTALKGPEQKTSPDAFETGCEVPMWLHRQKLFLRMCYHMACMILLRPFACVAPRGEDQNLTANELSVACAKHASALTVTIDANLDSGSFNVLSQATGCQWLATLCLVGFTTTHPTGPHTPAARKALSLCGTNFERLSKHRVPQAREAMRKARLLCAIAEEEVQQSIAALSSLQTPLDSALDVPFPPVGSTEHVDSDTPFLFTDLGMEVEWGNIPGEMDLGDSIHTTSAARTS